MPRSRRAAAFTVIVALALAGAAPIVPAQNRNPGDVTVDASLTGIAQFESNLDRGGSFHWGGMIARASLGRQLTPAMAAALELRYDYDEWKFSADSFAGRKPWEHIHRPGIGLDLSYAVAPDLRVGLSPSIGWAYESPATTADAEVFGALASVTKIFSPTSILGIGAGVFRQIGKTKVFPFPIVRWQIDDHLRITNPFSAGPGGGAGLELAYAFANGWEVAGGATYRSLRFRLANDGAFPAGIGESSQIPVYMRASRALAPGTRVDIYAGVASAGKLTVSDRDGAEIISDKYGVAPAIGLTVSHRF